MLNKITGTMPKVFQPLKKTVLTTIAVLALSAPGFAQKSDSYESESTKKEQNSKTSPVYGFVLGIIGIAAGIGYSVRRMDKSDKDYERKVREENGF